MNANTNADLVVAAYSNAITTGDLIGAIRAKEVDLPEDSTAGLQDVLRGPVSFEIPELPSASPSREPSSLPSLEPSAVPSTVPSSSPSTKKEQKVEQKEAKAEQKKVKKEAKTEQKDVKKDEK
jgi:hypothetical protein